MVSWWFLWYQAITSTNVDFLSVMSSGIQSTAMFIWILKISITSVCLIFSHLKAMPHLPGANELISWWGMTLETFPLGAWPSHSDKWSVILIFYYWQVSIYSCDARGDWECGVYSSLKQLGYFSNTKFYFIFILFTINMIFLSENGSVQLIIWSAAWILIAWFFQPVCCWIYSKKYKNVINF